jgi:hypothetical protein
MENFWVAGCEESKQPATQFLLSRFFLLSSSFAKTCQSHQRNSLPCRCFSLTGRKQYGNQEKSWCKEKVFWPQIWEGRRQVSEERDASRKEGYASFR